MHEIIWGRTGMKASTHRMNTSISKAFWIFTIFCKNLSTAPKTKLLSLDPEPPIFYKLRLDQSTWFEALQWGSDYLTARGAFN